jgi:integrase
MRRFRFSVAALNALTTDKAREYVHDDQVPALALLVTASGAKSFYVEKKVEGKKVQVRLGSLAEITIPQARAKAAEIISQFASGDTRQVVRRRPLPMEQVMREYLAFAQEHLNANTLKEYIRQWERYIKPWMGNKPLASIRRRDVTAFHQHIGQNCGRPTANRVIALLRAAINRAIREHELDLPNPARSITFYREEGRTRRLSKAELPAFMKAVGEYPNRTVRDMLYLALFTGARKGNLIAMRWEDISFEMNLWTVPAAKSKSGHELPVALSSHAMRILTARRSLSPSPFVFPGNHDGHMGSPNKAWIWILERAGMPGFRMHDLRRSLASFQIDTGTPLEVIQKTLGHESKVTTEVYARMAMGPVMESLERATEEMLKGCGDLNTADGLPEEAVDLDV